jgi:hypothetical protein
MAWLVGWRVLKVVIGFGPVLWQFSCGRAAVEVRVWMVMGYVVPGARHYGGARIKSALVFFAGPGIELALVALAYLALGHETLLSVSENYAVIAVQGACLAALMGAFTNLFPAKFYFKGDMAKNDGLGIVLSLFGSERTLREMVQIVREESRWEGQES